VELTAEQNVLTITAERRFDPQEADEVLVAERPQGRFTRQLLLGENLDVDSTQASYENGVLTLTIPVAEQAKPRRIEISGSGGGPTTIEANREESA
jgi:HSP20 family protein